MAAYMKQRFLLGVFVLMFMSTGLVRVERTEAKTIKAQPELLALVTQQPTSRVNVIVQATTDTAALVQTIKQLGGTVTHDLEMIKAVAATVPAAVVPQLAERSDVHWVSQDAQTVRTSSYDCTQCVNPQGLLTTYPQTVGATTVWNQGPKYLQGRDVTVAVVDSGIYDSIAFSKNPYNGPSTGESINSTDTVDDTSAESRARRIIAKVKFNSTAPDFSDGYGHGTHIAGVIAGNGTDSNGQYIGIAPRANLINVKVSDDNGGARMSDVVAGLQWIYQNKSTYNIRVVNISLNSTVNESYHVSPLSAAVEILWFNGIVVVVSAGNNGSTNSGVLYPPANDPFVITVGATNEAGTTNWRDDYLAPFSAYGVTENGFSKPDLVAPGTNIVSVRSPNNVLSQQHPSHNVGSSHFRMSGTSMAAAITSGAVALLLQDEPHLTPDQVKYRLTQTARRLNMGSGNHARYLDIPAAINGSTTASSNTGIAASQLLWSGSDAVTWDSVSWNSVSWNSVSWNSVSWNSVSWNSVSWNSVNWDP